MHNCKVGDRVRCNNIFRLTYMRTGEVTRIEGKGGTGREVVFSAVVRWDEGGPEEERNPLWLSPEGSTEPFSLGDGVELHPKSPPQHIYEGQRGIITKKSETYLYVTVEGKNNDHGNWQIQQQRVTLGGWYATSVRFLHKQEVGVAEYNIGDRVRFVSGPFDKTEATVNHVEQQGKLIWVTLPSGEKSGAWFPSRFVLVAKRDNPQEVEAVKGNNAQTYQVALQGLQRLVEAGITGVSLRPRSWDTKGLYAAIEVAEKDGVKKLYTPEQVDNYLAALKPIDSVGDKHTWGWRFRTEKANTIYGPSGSSYWTEEEITQAGGRVAQGGKFYRLCRNVPTPFVP